jgi:hypothetical protein
MYFHETWCEHHDTQSPHYFRTFKLSTVNNTNMASMRGAVMGAKLFFGHEMLVASRSSQCATSIDFIESVQQEPGGLSKPELRFRFDRDN